MELFIAEIESRASPDWGAARDAILSATEDELQLIQDAAAVQDGTEWHDTWAAELRAWLIDDIEMIEAAWRAGGDHETEVFTRGATTVLRSGGLSDGDAPTRMYSAIVRFLESPAARASGIMNA
jgi:hypothetical protein